MDVPKAQTQDMADYTSVSEGRVYVDLDMDAEWIERREQIHPWVYLDFDSDDRLIGIGVRPPENSASDKPPVTSPST